MASGEQVKALLRAYKEADEPQLLTLALQIAAREAKAGHARLADDIRKLVDGVKARGAIPAPSRRPVPIATPKGVLAELVTVSYPEARLDDLVLCNGTRSRLEWLLREQRQAELIREHGLEPLRKALLVGPPGTGKTFSAAAVAGELSLPLFTLRLESLFTRYMGEAAGHLKLIFDNIRQVRGVYFFDEFDAIGQQRASSNDIGEARRILNSFLQLVEQDDSSSVILAATNHAELLDVALFRRFDDVLSFELPGPADTETLLKHRLSRYANGLDFKQIIKASAGLSFADLQRACDDVIKEAVVFGVGSVSTVDVLAAIDQRVVDRKSFIAKQLR